MVMESSNDHKVIKCSTIALLQERFRQLERVKEMREERVKFLKSPPPEFERTANKYYIHDKEPPASSRLFFHSEIIHPTTTCSRKPPPSKQLVHLSLWPNSEIHQYHDYKINTSNYMNATMTPNLTANKYSSWLIKDVAPLPGSCSTIKIDHSATDVDTSLHL